MSGFLASNFATSFLGATSTGFAPWTLIRLGNCILWIDALQGITTVSNKVSQWNDISGNNLAFVQATDVNRPSFADLTINNKPVVVGSSASRLDITGMSVPTAATFFLVITKTILSTAYLASGNGGVFGIIQNFSGSSIEWFNGSGTDRLTFNSTPTSGPHLLTATQTNSGPLTLYYDGVQVASKATAAANLVSLEAIFNVTGGTTNGYGGDLAELIIFSRVLNSTEISIIKNYLSAKYSLTLS